MRSEQVFAAMAKVPNRFLLIRLAAAATRKFHRPNTRIEETMDEILARFGHAASIEEIMEMGRVHPLHKSKIAA